MKQFLENAKNKEAVTVYYIGTFLMDFAMARFVDIGEKVNIATFSTVLEELQPQIIRTDGKFAII